MSSKKVTLAVIAGIAAVVVVGAGGVILYSKYKKDKKPSTLKVGDTVKATVKLSMDDTAICGKSGDSVVVEGLVSSISANGTTAQITWNSLTNPSTQAVGACEAGTKAVWKRGDAGFNAVAFLGSAGVAPTEPSLSNLPGDVAVSALSLV